MRLVVVGISRISKRMVAKRGRPVEDAPPGGEDAIDPNVQNGCGPHNAGEECNVPVEDLSADQAGGWLDFQRQQLEPLLDASPPHREAEYSHARPEPQGAGAWRAVPQP